MCSEELGFLHAICSSPKDDTPRLVYADWLEGQDTVSVECAECKGNGRRPGGYDGGVSVACWRCHGTGYTTDNSRRDRAEFIRVQCELAQDQYNPFPNSCDRRTRLWRRWDALRRRERELLDAPRHGTHGVSNWGLWAKDVLDRIPSRSGVYSIDFPVQFRRGFISQVTITAEDWLKHADAIYWHPEQTVECPRCGGDGMAHGADRPFEWSPDPDYMRCPAKCDKGRIPRPFAPTAHPLERVTLTTCPPELGTSPVLWLKERWPHIEEFTLTQLTPLTDFRPEDLVVVRR